MSQHCAPWIRDFARDPNAAHGLDRSRAAELLAAILDGAVPDRELGALLAAIRHEGATLDQTLGFLDALDARVARLAVPRERPRPVVLPSYDGALQGANLTPLVALMLARYGVPVLVHGFDVAGGPDGGNAHAGSAQGGKRIGSATILERLGILPSLHPDDAQARLERAGVAYLPTAVLSPSLAGLLARVSPADAPSFGRSLAKLVAPFGGAGVRVVGVSRPDRLPRMREALASMRADALLLGGAEGEPFANPLRCPRIEQFRAGKAVRVLEADEETAGSPPDLPPAADVDAVAEWTAGALSGSRAIPEPILVQIGLLLEATREPVAA